MTPAPRPPRRLLRFGGGAGAAALAVLGASLWLGPSRALGSTGVVLVLVLAWPILASLVSILIFGLFSLAPGGAEPGEAGEAGLTIGVEGGAWYYRLLLSTRSPVFWGSLAGAVLSLAGLYVYVDRMIRPLEEESVADLEALATELQAHRQESGAYPEQVEGGALHEALGLGPGARWRGQSLLDAWSRPVLYQLRSDENGEHFLVYSAGYDGRPEDGRGDDLVAEGETPAEGGVIGRIGRWVGGLFRD